jgi:hypothetical protein
MPGSVETGFGRGLRFTRKSSSYGPICLDVKTERCVYVCLETFGCVAEACMVRDRACCKAARKIRYFVLLLLVWCGSQALSLRNIPFMVYHIDQYSSVGAYLGGLHMNRSTTRGFRSIIARWSWYMSNTLFLVMPAGSGVIVVKKAVFGILYLLSE